MKRIILTLTVLFAVMAAGAQARWGVTAGADVTNLSFKQNLFAIDKAVGYSGGVIAEVIFPGIGFGIDTGVLYQQRGAVLHLGDKTMWSSQGYGINRAYLHYLDIPLHLRFKFTRMGGFEEFFAPIAFAGPDFGFLLGHNKIEAIDFATGQIGLTVGLGMEIMKNWQITASHTWGVTYALKMKILSNDSARNSTWNLRVAYLF